MGELLGRCGECGGLCLAEASRALGRCVACREKPAEDVRCEKCGGLCLYADSAAVRQCRGCRQEPGHYAAFDLDGNGVPDYQEGWFWRAAWRGFAWAVRTFCPPHTLLYRAVERAEAAAPGLHGGGVQ